MMDERRRTILVNLDAFPNDELKEHIRSELQRLMRDPSRCATGDLDGYVKQEDEFFSRYLEVPVSSLLDCAHDAHALATALDRLNRCILEAAGVGQYELMHKGTLFYFRSLSAYDMGDFERAFFYMDSAVSEDHRAAGTCWEDLPAGRFMRLDVTPNAQNPHGETLTRRARSAVENTLARVSRLADAGFPACGVDDLCNSLIARAVNGAPELRTAVTAFLTFTIEFESRRTMLQLGRSEGGTAEPFYLHLFKGCVLFETLVRASAVGQRIAKEVHLSRVFTQALIKHVFPSWAHSQPTHVALNNLIAHRCMRHAMGLSRAIKRMRSVPFPEIFKQVDTNVAVSTRAVKVAYQLRNATAHSLADAKRPYVEEYETLFDHVSAAIVLAIRQLYSDPPESPGAA